LAKKGVWAETPLLVSTLPEGWTLLSYIVVITQLANVGPLLYSLLYHRYKVTIAPNALLQRIHPALIPFVLLFLCLIQNIQGITIHLILIIGIIGSLLLACFWNVTGTLFESERSTAFLGLLFVFALVDCTTSVLYIPYLSKLQSKFVFPLFIGEGLSGLIPSVISLVQGTADAAGDHQGLRFSVSTYFVILSGLLVISWAAFWLLNSDDFINDFRRVTGVPGERTPIVSRAASKKLSDNELAQAVLNISCPISINSNASATRPLTKSHTLMLLLLQGLTSCLANSVLSALQTYTAMPYGLSAYHLACNLALFASPSASLLAFCFDSKPIDSVSNSSVKSSGSTLFEASPPITTITTSAVPSDWSSRWKRLFAQDQRVLTLKISTGIQFICAAYLLFLAAVHKQVPAADSWIGATVMISAWIGFSFFASFCKTLICSLLRTRGPESALFHYGVYTQIGSLVGAIPTFIITNFTDYFR
jgi:riboflavin transporter 2